MGFSAGTHLQKPISSSQPPSSGTRALLPSSDSRSALKSILKTCLVEENAIETTDGSQDVKRPLTETMDSIVQQLSQDDRSISVDAYQTLASVIREYDEIPEEDVLKAKINTIMKYIKRDLTRPTKPDEEPIAATNLTVQALKVLVIFVWNRDYASLLSDDYRIFVLDRSIQLITEHAAPKIVVVHYLHLLAVQNFRANLLTSQRVARLLEALKSLNEYIKGNGVLSEMLLVYQKLLDQARPTMKAKANLWAECLLTAMTNSLKDIRTKAIALGLKSCSAFPASSSISAIIRSLLARELVPGKTFSSVMCRKLEKMIAIKEEGVHVPQIWITVLMLSNSVDDRDRNSSGARFDKWALWKDWLRVVQTCFNCSESAVKQQSYMAWNRFIHIVQPHQTSDELLQLLAKPLTAQIERRVAEQTSKGNRSTAVSSYCTLLYYAFRPAATHKQYTPVWNEYIVTVMKSSFFERNPANADIASRILIALFWHSKRATKIWNENRGLENTPVEPEELPTIDCKWIRSRSRAILDMFRLLMRYSSWGASGQSDKAYIFMAWTQFLKALREASSKEIKPSTETIEAMIHVTSWLGRHYGSLQDPSSGTIRPIKAHILSIAQVRQLTVSAITELGQDLVLAGLKDKGNSLCKALVIYDALQSYIPKVREVDDPTSGILENCLEALHLALVGDFKSEKTLGTTVGIDQLRGRLEHSSPCHVVYTLKLLKRPTVLLLKEDISNWQDKDQHDAGRPYPEIIATTMTLLANLPPTSVHELDETFAALFSSTHKLVVEDAVEMWNHQFGKMQSLSIGPLSSEALTTLQELGVEVSIPDQSPASEEQNVDEPLPQFASKVVTAPMSTSLTSPSPKKSSQAWPSPELGSQYVHSAAIEVDATAVRSAERPASRPRSRHDDSQVHFVPIESSPLPQEDPESQLLTTHQKEVRDRKRSEPAVVFPDLRSSPKRRSVSLTKLECGFARKAAAQPERPTTPTLPTDDDQGETEIMASPTPRARHVANNIADVEVPSSPPSMAGHNDKHDITSSPPPMHAAEVQHRTDLAIDINGHATTEDGAEQDQAVVEQKAFDTEMDIDVSEPDAERMVEGLRNEQARESSFEPDSIFENANRDLEQLQQREFEGKQR